MEKKIDTGTVDKAIRFAVEKHAGTGYNNGIIPI